MKVALDANILIHFLAKSSDEHPPTRRCYLEYVDQGAEFVVAETALLEAFSVLSRAPEPFGMKGEVAEQLLQRDFGRAMIAPIRAGLSWDTIRHTLARGHKGGRVYDAMIALAVREAGAEVLLTWNVRHFLSIAPVGLEIREPR